MDFIAFDLETTGFVAGVDQIVEIGAIRFISGEVEAIFTTLVDPRIPISESASAVNGITPDMLVGKPRIENLLEAFSDFCGALPLVAHNAPFDTQFLISDFKKFEIKTPEGLVLDSCAMARNVYRGLANYKLSTLVQYLNIESNQFHRAEADAMYCGKLFQRMLERLDDKSPERLIQLTGKSEMRFPKVEKKPKQLGFFDLI